jgi:hypothetical protein
MHLAALDRAAPGVAGPGFDGTRRKHVDVPVQDEMAAGAAAREGPHDVRKVRLRGPDLDRDAAAAQMVVEEGRGLGRVARRIGTGFRDELGQELNQGVALLIDPSKKAASERVGHEDP